MSTPEVVGNSPSSVPLAGRMVGYLAVGCARLLATQPPRRIRRILRWLRTGARAATYEEAKVARDAVTAVSLLCAAREGCLPRSLATILLCRARGAWPAWCVGARRVPPFGAHAWVEADGVPVDEHYPPDYFRVFFRVA